MRLFRLRHYLFSRLWFVPVLCVLAGGALSFLTIALDRAAGGSAVPESMSGDPQAAIAILSAVAVSMVTLTGLVLTITMVVVQLAIGQFSPRILRTILHDRPSQIAIGVFVATFAHSILVMREVRAASGRDEGSVPGLAVVVAFVLVLVSIVVLVLYVNHIGQSLRVASLIKSVGKETAERLEELYPDRDEDPARGTLPEGAPDRVIPAPRAGVLYKIAANELVDKAKEADVVLRLSAQIGDFLPEGAPLIEVYGRGALDETGLLRSVALGTERTMHEDVAYGFRMLVDVAERSLSPSIIDPTTAVQAIDRIHDNLRRLGTRPFPSGHHADEDGRLRLVVPVLSWDGYVRLAVDEIRHYAATSIQVIRRLRSMLEDLLNAVPPDRRPVLEHELELVRRLATRNFDDEEDAEAATRPDRQGIGSGEDTILDSARTEARPAARVRA